MMQNGPEKGNRISQIRQALKIVRQDSTVYSLAEKRAAELTPSIYESRFNRSGAAYIDELGGLEFTFKFIKKRSQPRVLDAGTGTGKGIVELSKTLGADIEIYGVGFNLSTDQLPDNLKNNFFQSDFESLRGIKAGTLGGIISLHGVFEYSIAPGLVVHKADKLLAPNGVIKVASTIDHTKMSDQDRERKLASFKFYIQSFRKLGYGVAETGYEINTYHTDEVVLFLAIKPGEDFIYKDNDAMNLLIADSIEADKQIVLHKKKLELLRGKM